MLRCTTAFFSASGVCVHEGIRHSTISEWARMANAHQVRELGRIGDMKTADIYVHNAMTDLRNIVNRNNVIEMRRSDANPIRRRVASRTFRGFSILASHAPHHARHELTFQFIVSLEFALFVSGFVGFHQDHALKGLRRLIQPCQRSRCGQP